MLLQPLSRELEMMENVGQGGAMRGTGNVLASETGMQTPFTFCIA